MGRVAVVTGGSRGIGAAISKALKAAGYKVAANYAGNDEAAAKFKAETGIPVYKWDVSNYDACVAGLKQVETDLGPVEVLVNNAGITRDAMFHKMTAQQWNEVINTNLNSLFNMTQPIWGGMRDRVRPRDLHLLHQRPEGSGLATTRRLSDSGNAIADRHHRSRRRWEPNDLTNGGIAATAELASVERCSAPETRPPNRRPATTQLACVERCSIEVAAAADLHVECRRRPSATGTSPHPDKPGWWRGAGEGHPVWF